MLTGVGLLVDCVCYNVGLFVWVLFVGLLELIVGFAFIAFRLLTSFINLLCWFAVC